MGINVTTKLSKKDFVEKGFYSSKVKIGHCFLKRPT